VSSALRVVVERSFFTSEEAMIKACIGGALVALAVWFTPSLADPPSSLHGGQIAPPCSGTMERFVCGTDGICFEEPLNFGFRDEAGLGADQTRGNLKIVCTSPGCRLNVVTEASKSACSER